MANYSCRTRSCNALTRMVNITKGVGDKMLGKVLNLLAGTLAVPFALIMSTEMVSAQELGAFRETSLVIENKEEKKDDSKKSDESSLEDRLNKIEKQLADRAKADKEKKEKDAQKPSFKPSARIHVNGAYFDTDDVINNHAGDLEDGVNLRRARLGASGSYLDQYHYKLEADFAPGGDVSIKDAYGEMTKLPVLSDLRVGHFKESIGSELLASSNNTWFIERAAIINATASHIGDRSLGLAIGNGSLKKNWLWNTGIYRPTSDKQVSYKDDNDGYNFVTRIAGLLYENEESGQLMHVGFGYGFYSRDKNNTMNWGATLENSLCGNLVSTGAFAGTDTYHAFVPEFIWTNGFWAVQSDIYFVQLNNDLYGDQDFTGGYCQVGYWLTGEHFKYEKGKGYLGGTAPNENFIRRCENCSLKTGPGAWMLGYRFSWTDLSWMPTANAGKLYTHTIGLNWQLTPNTRWMFNYNIADAKYNVNHEKGVVHGVGSMFQLFF